MDEPANYDSEETESDKPDNYDSEETESDERDDEEEVVLFEMETPSTNRLVIPFVLASTHFPRLATTEEQDKTHRLKLPIKETLQFTDSQNHEWYMDIQYYGDEHGFMILTGWPEFSTLHNLKPMDLIRVSRPAPRLHTHHFLISVEKKEQGMYPPEFKDENFLFRIKLDQSDIDFSRVFLPGDDVMRNFPGVEMERNSGEKKIMKFTDAKCKDWYMNIIRYDEKNYMGMEGWDEFVKERGVEAGDLIRFYKHVYPCHNKHFLIRIAKKRGTGGPGPGQPSGGSGPGSSSQSYKGKEIARGW